MRILTILASTMVLFMVACTHQPVGTLKGKVSPSEPRAQITIVQDGKPIMSCNAAPFDGTFSADVKPGVYTLIIASAASTFPVTLADIMIKANETTLVPPVNLAVQTGKAVIAGKVTPACPGTKVKLMCEGKERAAAHIGADGKYEFNELPAGNYAIRTEAPGYAEETSSFDLSADQKTEQNVLLLPKTVTPGVDWTSGKIRATGHGQPPVQAVSSTVRHEMTKRAALSDAERNLLKIIENIRISSSLDIRSYMQDATHAERIHGFIRGYTVVSETDRDDGSVEVTLELPITGPTGLTHYITE